MFYEKSQIICNPVNGCCVCNVTSCSKDDGGGQDRKKLSEVVWYYPNNTIDMILIFRYANGKLIKIMAGFGENEESCTITYSGKNVIITGFAGNQTLRLNNAGFVESGTLLLHGDLQYGFTCEYSNGYSLLL